MATTIKIHHATITKVRKAGFEFEDAPEADRFDDGTGIVLKNKQGAVSQVFANAAEASAAVDKLLAGDKDAVILTGGKPVRDRNGVMATTYHQTYMAQGGGNGDHLDIALRSAVRGGDDKVDVKLCREIGISNEVWNEAWENLNPGMQRMNLANRLRAKLRRSEAATVTLGKETGRFGIGFQPPKGKAKKTKLVAAGSETPEGAEPRTVTKEVGGKVKPVKSGPPQPRADKPARVRKGKKS